MANINDVTFRLSDLTELLEMKRGHFVDLRREYVKRGDMWESGFYAGAKNACDQILDDLLYVAEQVTEIG